MSYYYQGSPAYYQQPAYGNSTLQQPFAPRGQSHYNYAATSIPQTSAYYSAPYPPPQPTRQMSPPAQQPQQELNDPNVFRSYFRSGLAALTSNSRPIIQDLTTLAHQYLLRMSTVISDELLNHIRHAHPSIRLPALYLSDAIVKNIGNPYIGLFARWMDRAFLESFRLMDPLTQQKMEELLGSWRTGGPDGSMVYPERLLKAIEEGLYGFHGRGGGIAGQGKPLAEASHYTAGLQQRPSQATQEEVSQLLSQIRSAKGVSMAKAHRDPTDHQSRQSLVLLDKLENIVSEAGVSNDQADLIRKQLAELTIEAAPVASTSTAPPPPPPQPVSTDPSALNPSVASLLQTLNPSLLSNSTAFLAPPAQQRDPAELKYESKLFHRYDRDHRSVGLTAANINRPKAESAELLYQDMSLQCTQCGARWLDNERHRKVMQKHMDRHFRINNKLSGALRAQSRNWLTMEEDWLSAPMPEAEDPEKQYEAEIAAEVSRSFVKVPADPLRASKPCPICKEKFKQQFNEQQEDFVWRDAKMVDGVVYHASCYLEMKKARASSKKAKTEGGTPSLTNSAPPSRECTPQLPFGSTSSSQEQSGITFTASPSQKNVPVKVEESEPSIPPQPTANGSNDSEVKPPEAQQHAPAAAPLSLDSNLLAHLANIVSRSNTPQTQEVPAQANEVHQSSPHSRKRSVEVLQTTQSNSADDNSMPEAKRVKQEEGVDEDETLYGVSAHPH